MAARQDVCHHRRGACLTCSVSGIAWHGGLVACRLRYDDATWSVHIPRHAVHDLGASRQVGRARCPIRRCPLHCHACMAAVCTGPALDFAPPRTCCRPHGTCDGPTVLYTGARNAGTFVDRCASACFGPWPGSRHARPRATAGINRRYGRRRSHPRCCPHSAQWIHGLRDRSGPHGWSIVGSL